ncbi:MAG TPA: WD40 repeat domain-containing protein [Spirochaetota bacterium]|nr:WD40 repeat domain-containing protein [Spirochaetota bacterium]
MNNWNPEIIIQKSHFGTIKNVRFSHDSRYLAVVPFEGSIDFRDIRGHLMARKLFFNGSVGGFHWHPEENLYYAASYDGKVLMSDCYGNVHMSLDHGGYLNSFDIAADGSALVTEGGGTVHLWNNSGSLTTTLAVGADDIRRAGFLHDGRVFLLEGEDKMRVLNSGGKDDRVVTFTPGWIESVESGRDGTVLLSMSEGLFRAGEHDTEFMLLHDGNDGVYCARFSPDGETIAVAHSDGALFLLDLGGNPLRELEHHPNTILDLSWSPDGKYLATGCADCAVRLYNSEGDPVWTLHGNDSMIRGFRFDSDGSFSPYPSKESLYDSLGVPEDVRDFLLGHATILPVGSIAGVGCMPDGGIMAAWDDTVQLYGHDGTPGIRIRTGGEHINCAAVSADGKYIAAGCSGGTLFFWNTAGETIREVTSEAIPVMKLAWNSRDNLWAVSRMQPDMGIELFNEEGEFIRKITGPGNEVSALAFSADGGYLAAGSHDGHIYICDVNGNSHCLIQDPDGMPVHAVAMGAGGMIISGSGNGVVRIWERERCRRSIVPKHGDDADVHDIHLLSDGSFVCGYIIYEESRIVIMITRRDKTGGLLKKKSFGGQPCGIALSLAVDENIGCIIMAMVNRITLLGLDGETKGTIKVSDARISAMEINASPEISLIASGFEDGTLELRRFNGDVIACLELEGGSVKAVAMSGDRVLAAMAGSAVYVLSAEGNLLNSFSAGKDITAMAVCPGNDAVALGFGDNSIGLFSISGELIRAIPGEEEYNVPVKIVFSPDGSMMAAGYAQGNIVVFNEKGAAQCAIHGFSVLQNTMIFHHSGNLLIFGTVDLFLVIADVHSGETVLAIVPEGEEYLVYTPRGEYDYSIPELAGLITFSDGEHLIPAENGTGTHVPGLLQKILREQ